MLLKRRLLHVDSLLSCLCLGLFALFADAGREVRCLATCAIVLNVLEFLVGWELALFWAWLCQVSSTRLVLVFAVPLEAAACSWLHIGHLLLQMDVEEALASFRVVAPWLVSSLSLKGHLELGQGSRRVAKAWFLRVFGGPVLASLRCLTG